MEKAELERYLDQGLSLAQIGAIAGRDPSTVGYWVKKFGLTAIGRDNYAPRGGLTREQLTPLVEACLSQREIADELGVSVSTVRHWLHRYSLETKPFRRRRARADAALQAGLRSFEHNCVRHGSTTFVVYNDGRSRCKRCNAEAVVRRRRKVKAILVAEAGGCCNLCGYDRCTAALHFHHLDPAKKSFSLSLRGVTRSLDTLREEAQKCVLLCSNCHAEVEAGVTRVPLKSISTDRASEAA